MFTYRYICIQLISITHAELYNFFSLDRPRSIAGDDEQMDSPDSDASSSGSERKRKNVTPVRTRKPFKPSMKVARRPLPSSDEDSQGEDEGQAASRSDSGDGGQTASGGDSGDGGQTASGGDSGDGGQATSGSDSGPDEGPTRDVRENLHLIADTGRTWKKKNKKFSPFPGSAKVLTPSLYERKRMEEVSAFLIHSILFIYNCLHLVSITCFFSPFLFFFLHRTWALRNALKT